MTYDLDSLANQVVDDMQAGADGLVSLPVDGYTGEWVGEGDEEIIVEDLDDADVGARFALNSSMLRALKGAGRNLRVIGKTGRRATGLTPARTRFAPSATPYMPRMQVNIPRVSNPVPVGPKAAGPTVLPIDSIGNLPVGGDQTIIINPLFIARGTKLVVSPGIATAFEVGNPSVGGVQAWAAGGTVPGDCFPPDGVPNSLTPSMNPSQGLQLPVSNISGAPARFRGYYAVEAARSV